MAAPRCVAVPGRDHYVLANAHVPTGCIQGGSAGITGNASLCVDVDNLAAVDIVVRRGRVAALHPAGTARQHSRARQVDLAGKMVLPTFADLHTHIGGPSLGVMLVGLERVGLPEPPVHGAWCCRCAWCCCPGCIASYCKIEFPHLLATHAPPALQTRATPRSAAATLTAA